MTIPHRLAQDEALERIKTFFGELRDQFAGDISDLCEEWNGNGGAISFSAWGFSVLGTLRVKSSEVELLGTLPDALSSVAERIKSEVGELLSSRLA